MTKSLRLALYGYGKMGKAIEAVALSRGHEVVLRVGGHNAGVPPTGVDVAIEFSKPDRALDNMGLCMAHGVPVVVGTTGWYDQLETVRQLVRSSGGSLLWASNFSIGVNMLFRVNRMLASLMDQRPGYAVHIDEVHHVHKLDAPSGTAITLARDIDLSTDRYAGWRSTGPGEQQAPNPSTVAPNPVPIASERVGEVPGKHSITWSSANDRLTITHEAFDRSGFALGAVIAAEWLHGRQGLFTMDDVLNPA